MIIKSLTGAAMTQEQFKEPTEAAAAGSPSPVAAAGDHPSSAAPSQAAPARGSAALWRGLAGMVLSLALACVIVAIEFSTQANHRANLMRARMGALSAKVRKLGAAVNAQRARLSAARSDLAAAQALRALLLAPDLATIRLAPARGGSAPAPSSAPQPGAADAPSGPAEPPAASAVGGGAARVGDAQSAAVQRGASAERPRALLMFSLKEGRAALQAAGLGRPARDRVFVLWWRAARGTLRRAGEFHTAANGSALLTVALPHGFSPAVVLVTAESTATDGVSPQGEAVLRGALGRTR